MGEMTPEREAEIRNAVVEIDDPFWPCLPETTWCSWVEDLLAEIDRLREKLREALEWVEEP